MGCLRAVMAAGSVCWALQAALAQRGAAAKAEQALSSHLHHAAARCCHSVCVTAGVRANRSLLLSRCQTAAAAAATSSIIQQQLVGGASCTLLTSKSDSPVCTSVPKKESTSSTSRACASSILATVTCYYHRNCMLIALLPFVVSSAAGDLLESRSVFRICGIDGAGPQIRTTA